MSETAAIPTLDGADTFPAYVARPAGEAKAAIIVIQEIFGVNAGIRAKCDDWAAQGYLAVAPELFWRFAPGCELDPDVPEQLQEGFGHPKYAPCPLLVNMVTAGKLGVKSGEGFYVYSAGSKELVVSERFK